MYLALPPDVVPALGSRCVSVLAKVAVLGTRGIKGDAEVDVEDPEEAISLGARRPSHGAGVGGPDDVLLEAGRACVGDGARDGILRTTNVLVYFYSTQLAPHTYIRGRRKRIKMKRVLCPYRCTSILAPVAL